MIQRCLLAADVKTTGVYYFPGLYSAILPMIPGIYTIRRVVRATRVTADGGRIAL